MELPRYVILRIEDYLAFLIAGGLGCPFTFLLGLGLALFLLLDGRNVENLVTP